MAAALSSSFTTQVRGGCPWGALERLGDHAAASGVGAPATLMSVAFLSTTSKWTLTSLGLSTQASSAALREASGFSIAMAVIGDPAPG